MNEAKINHLLDNLSKMGTIKKDKFDLCKYFTINKTSRPNQSYMKHILKAK